MVLADGRGGDDATRGGGTRGLEGALHLALPPRFHPGRLGNQRISIWGVLADSRREIQREATGFSWRGGFGDQGGECPAACGGILGAWTELCVLPFPLPKVPSREARKLEILKQLAGNDFGKLQQTQTSAWA